MAQYTKHPVSAPPAAPARESTGHLLLRAYAILVFVVAFAHTALYNLIGQVGAGVMMILLTLAALAIAIPMIARADPHPFLWRRLPWSALGYVAFALVSVAWSQWRVPTLLTWLLLAAVTVNALLVAHAFSWQEIVRALASAFKWILGLSLALELWVSLVLHGPLLPNFLTLPNGDIDPHWYWVRDNLLDGGRIQGVVGNSNVLAIISLFAIVTFGVRFALRARWRTTLAMWMLLAAYMMFRASSATTYVCALAAAVVLLVALLIRRTRTPGARTRIYAICGGAVVVVVALLTVFHRPLFDALGRSADLTGRTDLIWTKVLERAAAHPIFGNGFSSPWIPTDPSFDGWITDHGITVFHAHNMWLDVLMQLGVVGVVLMAAAYLSLLWRAWFFAADRPRWNLRADRPYSPLTLLPLLFTVILLVQGLAESTPIMLWGWLLLMVFSFKIKSVPLVGVGLSEQSRVLGARQQGPAHPVISAQTRLGRLLGSVEMARAYTLTALTAIFGSFAIERMTSTRTYATIILLLCVMGLAILVVRREELSLLRLAPSSLLAFLALALASVIWTTDGSDTLIGWVWTFGIAILAITIGHIRDTLQTVRAIGDTLRTLLIASLGVEILSGILLDVPIAFLDIAGNLAIGGPIQGIFGTRNMLGFVAVIALITFFIEWRTQSVVAPIAIPSIALAGFLALVSASPTVLVLAVAVGVVTAALTIVRHAPAPRRNIVQWMLGALVAATLIVAFAFRHPIIAWMGAGSDFSIRADLWNQILDFVAIRPFQGWGWFGPWQRGEYPFTYINYLLDNQHQTALNAYFDVLLQLGIAGFLLFVILGGVALIRSWLMASVRHSVVYAWTPLVLVTLGVDSMFESFTLAGAGWFMLVLCALRAGQSRSWRENIDAATTGVIPTLRAQE